MSIIIRLQNLPLEANSLDIRRFFQGLHIPDGGVHIVGGDQGDAFIAFGTDEDARQAMGRDGNTIKGSRIKLLLSSRNEMQRVIDAARNQTMSMMNINSGNVQPSSIGLNQQQQQPQQQVQQQSAPNSNVGPPVSISQQQPNYGPPSSIMTNQSSQQQYQGSTQQTNSGVYYQQQQQPPAPIGSSGSSNGPSFDRGGSVGYPPHHPSSYGPRSRSRSRSPPTKRFAEDYQSGPPSQQQQQLPPQGIGSMQSGLLSSLPPSQQQQQPPPMPPSYSQTNQQNSASSGPYGNSMYNQEPRDPPSYGYGAPNKESNSNYPPNEHERSWNQSSNMVDTYGRPRPAPVSSESNDLYRKMDSMHQPPSNSYSQPPPGGYPSNNNHGHLEPLLQAPSSGSAPPPPSIPPSKMFVLQLYGLPLNVRDIDLIKFFHPLYVNENNVKIFFDEKGFPTGQALVRFPTPREFETALSYNNRFLGDRPVQMRPLDEMNGPSSSSNQLPPPSMSSHFPPHPQQSLPPPAMKQTSPLMPTPAMNPNQDPYRSENYPPYRNAQEDMSSYNRPPQSQQQLPPQMRPRPKDLVVFMKGLPYSNCTAKDVAIFFEPLKLANIEIETDRNSGRPTGNAFVEFRDHQDFDRGMSYNMKHMKHRYIELIPLPLYEKHGPNYHMPTTMPPSKFRHSGGAGGDVPPITYCVSVRGLSKHVTSADLKSYFAKMNAETYAVHIMLTSDRMNAGEAFLEFITKENQRRALERDGDYIGSDRISIRPVPYEVVRQNVSPGLQPPPPPHGHPGQPSHHHHHRDYSPYGRDSPKRGGGGGAFEKYRSGRPLRGGGGGGPPSSRSGGGGGGGVSLPPFYDKATVLIAKNISSKARYEDLLLFFDDYHLTSNHIKFRAGSDDRTQEAQISFHTKADAEHAHRTMDKKYFLDHKIHLAYAT